MSGVIFRLITSACGHLGTTNAIFLLLKKRIGEHKNDLRNHRTQKAIVLHADQEGHLTRWTEAEILHNNLDKTKRWLVEAAYIQTESVTNISPGFYKLHPVIAKRIRRESRKYVET